MAGGCVIQENSTRIGKHFDTCLLRFLQNMNFFGDEHYLSVYEMYVYVIVYECDWTLRYEITTTY